MDDPQYLDIRQAIEALSCLGLELNERQMKRAAEKDLEGKRKLPFFIDPIDKKLKMNNLLPKLDVQYNFLTQTPKESNSLNIDNYKAGIKFKVPLFLRKERGDFKLAKIKLQDAKYNNEATKVTIKNKVNALQQELASFKIQSNYISNIVKDYNTLLKAEDRKFYLGESSLFLVNYREQKLIESRLKEIDLENSFFKAKSQFFKVLISKF